MKYKVVVEGEAITKEDSHYRIKDEAFTIEEEMLVGYAKAMLQGKCKPKKIDGEVQKQEAIRPLEWALALIKNKLIDKRLDKVKDGNHKHVRTLSVKSATRLTGAAARPKTKTIEEMTKAELYEQAIVEGLIDMSFDKYEDVDSARQALVDAIENKKISDENERIKAEEKKSLENVIHKR